MTVFSFSKNYGSTHWKRLWFWEGLGARGEGDDRGWDGWMASLTRWTWVWVYSRSWWWTGRPGMLWFMELQRVGHHWVTKLNWTELVLLSCSHFHRSKGSHILGELAFCFSRLTLALCIIHRYSWHNANKQMYGCSACARYMWESITMKAACF